MKRKSFKFWHSAGGTVLLLLAEAALLYACRGSAEAQSGILLIVAVAGALANIFVSTEVIREVRNATHMIFLLSAIVLEFVLFFAVQYWFFYFMQPYGFPGLTDDAVNLFLHSTMVFVFNPIYLPTTSVARCLMLIQTYGALAFVLFILQNVWQFRKPAA